MWERLDTTEDYCHRLPTKDQLAKGLARSRPRDQRAVLTQCKSRKGRSERRHVLALHRRLGRQRRERSASDDQGARDGAEAVLRKRFAKCSDK